VINILKKIGIFAIVLMFLATSIAVASAKDKITVESKYGGTKVTEYFNFCYVDYEVYDRHYIAADGFFNQHFLTYTCVEGGNGTITIKAPLKTLTINGSFDLYIKKERPFLKYLFNISQLSVCYIGRNYFNDPNWIHDPPNNKLWLKGIARGVTVTYYQQRI